MNKGDFGYSLVRDREDVYSPGAGPHLVIYQLRDIGKKGWRVVADEIMDGIR